MDVVQDHLHAGEDILQVLDLRVVRPDARLAVGGPAWFAVWLCHRSRSDPVNDHVQTVDDVLHRIVPDVDLAGCDDGTLSVQTVLGCHREQLAFLRNSDERWRVKGCRGVLFVWERRDWHAPPARQRRRHKSENRPQ